MFLLLFTAITITAIAQKGHDKDKKEHGQGHGKDQENHGTGKADKEHGNPHQDMNDDKDEHGNGNDKGNNGHHKGEKDDHGKMDGRGINGNGRGNDVIHFDDGKPGNNVYYNWTPATFRERAKIRNQEKVTICHKINGSDQPPVTLSVSINALQAHLNHGDTRGTCPAVAKSRYSDTYIQKRNAYYNNLVRAQEQVAYSRSMLDYARARLQASQIELARLRQQNRDAAAIQRKEAAVVEVQQNVSVMETLIGTATTLLVNKFL